MIGQLIAAVFGAVVTVIDKIALSKYKTDVRQYLVVIFIFLWFFTGLSLPFLARIEVNQAFSPTGLFYFSLLIFFAFVWNSIYYKAQKHESVQEFEVIIMTLPLFTALMAAMIFPDERNWSVFIATIIAGLALILSHIRKDHLTFNSYSWQLMIAILFMAAESQMRKILLDWYSPVSLYFVRTGILTFLFILIWHPKVINLEKPVWWHAAISGLVGSTEMILVFYGYQRIGIVMTTLILMLGPILIYSFDLFYLKEKVRPKTIAAAFVILLSIVYASLIA